MANLLPDEPGSIRDVPEISTGRRRASTAGTAIVRDLGWTAASFLLAGIAGGVLWVVLVTPTQVTRFPDSVCEGSSPCIAADTIQMTTIFPIDGWYALIAGVLGLAAGLGLTLVRRRDPVLMVVLVTLGAVLAAYVMAWVGGILGPGDPIQALAKAAVGTVADDRLHITAWVVRLVWPLSAAAGALMVLLAISPEQSDELSYSSLHDTPPATHP
ncbi:MAG: hypothetical protein QM655_12520 [Nocardioidaceae bacterium]